MNLKTSLAEVKFAKIENDGITDLTENESNSIKKFIHTLLDEDYCQIIFRGVSIERACKIAGVKSSFLGDHKKTLNKLGRSTFFIGEKASSYSYKSDEVSFPIDINNVHDDIFKDIFNEFKHLVNSRKAINNSFDNNFLNYFITFNEIQFVESIDKMDDEQKKLIKFYYLWLLHTIGDTAYKKYSHFVSTSKNYEIANKFGHREMVYCGWIPRPIKDRAVYLGSIVQSIDLIKSVGLPFYSDEPYPSEQEVSVLGAIFPHYILGIYHLPLKKFLINSYLLEGETMDLINSGFSDAIISFGVKIDQTIFSESQIFKDSIHKRYTNFLNQKFSDSTI